METEAGIGVTDETRLQGLLREAARSDRLFAADLLNQGRGPDALAHLARSITYDPSSTLAAEMSVVALNTWSHSIPSTICLGHTDIVNTAEFSPDGSQILTASQDGTARIWDASTGESLFALIGHSEEVNSAHFSSDGQWIVTASEDKTVRIWNVRTGEVVQVLESHDSVLNARFSPNGQTVLADACDFLGDFLAIWKVGTWELKSQVRSHCTVYEWQASANGELLLLAGAQGSAEVWEMYDAKLLTTLQHVPISVTPPAPVPEEPMEAKVEWHFINAQFSADGHWVITSGKDGIARVWNSRTGELFRSIPAHAAEIRHACFSRDGEWILTASEDKTAKVWSAKTGRLSLTLQHPDPVWEAHFCSDDLNIITITCRGSIRVWSALTGALLSGVSIQEVKQSEDGWMISPDERRVLFHLRDCSVRVFEVSGQRLGRSLRSKFKSVIHAQFSPDSRRVRTSHSKPLFQETDSQHSCEQIWDVGSGTQLGTLGDADEGGGFNPDGTLLITRSYEPGEQAPIWDTDTGELQLVLGGHGDNVCAVAFNPNGRQVATSSVDRALRLWDAITGRLQYKLPQPVREGFDYSTWIIYSPDGKRILTFTQTTAFLIWDAQTGELLWILDGQEEKDIKCWAWTPDSQRVAIGSEDHTAKIWDARTGQPLITIEVGSMPRSIVFDSAGRQVAIATWDDVRAWDAVTGARIHPPNRYGDSASWGCWFRISPEGRRALACTSGEITAWLWNVETGTKLVCLRGHEDEVREAAFSPDGRHLVTCSFDGIARLWELLATNDPPPSWFADFLRLMAQRKFNDDGELVAMAAGEFLALRDRLERIVPEECSRYAAIASHFLAQPAARFGGRRAE